MLALTNDSCCCHGWFSTSTTIIVRSRHCYQTLLRVLWRDPQRPPDSRVARRERETAFPCDRGRNTRHKIQRRVTKWTASVFSNSELLLPVSVYDLLVRLSHNPRLTLCGTLTKTPDAIYPQKEDPFDKKHFTSKATINVSLKRACESWSTTLSPT
jgi:hypothetical protein